MSTNIDAILPDLVLAMDTVSRELVGLIPSVMFAPSAARAAVGQPVDSPVVPANSATDITPGVTPPNDGNSAIGARQIVITKARRVPVRWTGEQQQGVRQTVGVNTIRQLQLAQGIRTLVNEVEADLAALHVSASRAAGAVGSTPFGTAGDYRDAARVAKILTDNGAPQADRSLVIDTTAGVNLRGLQSQAQMVGDASMLRQGVLIDLAGMAIRESGQILAPASGTGASATTNNAGYAVGATVITLASAGTGTIIAGDVITFAGDTNQYVVASGDADVSNGGTITLQAPGLRQAIAASATNITVVARSRRAMGFSRDAIALVTRAPALPDEGDLAIAREIITDPRSGLSIELALYPQYRQMQYELSLCWGCAVMKPEHLALLIGAP